MTNNLPRALTGEASLEYRKTVADIRGVLADIAKYAAALPPAEEDGTVLGIDALDLKDLATVKGMLGTVNEYIGEILD